MAIHPTAIISTGAQIGEGVEIGAYTVIGDDVHIGDRCSIAAHVVIEGPTHMGQENRVYPFCSLGADPQDKKYKGELTRLEIGDRNTIRECCTFNRGTVQDKGVTKIGNDNWIMAYVHVAHDCVVGNHVVFANNVQLAGHVCVGDYTVLGGFTGVHQFVRVGSHAMSAVGTVLLQDLLPFVMVSGNPAATHGINTEGLKRRGFSPQCISDIKQAYKIIFRQGLTVREACDKLTQEFSETHEVQDLIDFLSAPGRGIVR